METFLIKTLGCKVNTYESEFVRNLLLFNGYKEVEENADICIINSCTVTNTADNKSKQVINNIRKNNKDALVIAMGCFTQFRKNEIKDLIDADIIIGNMNKSKILDYIKEYEKNHKQIVDFYDMNIQDFEDMEINKYNHKHRAFIKIEDGCNNFCSYCIIPYVRGRVRSKEFNKAIIEANDLSIAGHKEIVLSGIHTGQYNSGSKRLSDLINELSKIELLKRIRLSSVEIVELDSTLESTNVFSLEFNEEDTSSIGLELSSVKDTLFCDNELELLSLSLHPLIVNILTTRPLNAKVRKKCLVFMIFSFFVSH